MKNIPKTLEDANIRIVAYMDKIIDSGRTETDSHYLAIEAFKKIKYYYISEIGTPVGDCVICKYPILHLREEYQVCVSAANLWESELKHKACIVEINENS